MNTYEKTLLETLSYKYPKYLFEFEEYPSMIIVWIKNRSSGVLFKRTILNYKDDSLILREIERMIEEMREEELKSNVGRWYNNSLTNSYLEIKPMAINKYSITPKEVVFQDEKTTIINWTDGTKTIVKCSDGDTFSPEAGVALCYMKRFITDNDSKRFHSLLKSLISVSKFKSSKKQEDKSSEINLGSLYQSLQDIKEAFSRIGTMEEKYDVDTGTPVNSGDIDSDGSSVEVE